MIERKICQNCVMDTSDCEIVFDSNGVCNHCNGYKALYQNQTRSTRKGFNSIIKRIRAKGKSYPYDCLVACSGGTDSSYMLHKLKDCGLRVLAAHYNSGWNSPEANHNVKVMTDIIGVDLYEYTIDFEEFRALQIAYLKAGVVDLDIPTDHALYAGLYQAALDNNVPTILTGHNSDTEFVMPTTWVTDKLDSRNLLDIYHKYGNGTPLRTYPLLTLRKKFIYYNLRNIEMIFILNYLDYDKVKASKEMRDAYGWERVRVKHGESIWTRFYQCYILPTRFGIDKRKAHYSNLILSGMMTREEALKNLKKSIYLDDFEADRKTILERYRISEAEFSMWMNQPIRSHSDFKNERALKKLYSKLRNIVPGLHISTRH